LCKHVGDKFGDLYRVPSDPVAGLMESQDLIAIETMLQQCLQSLIVANAAALQRTIEIAQAMRNSSKYVHASYDQRIQFAYEGSSEYRLAFHK
jgi:hypothetical protein